MEDMLKITGLKELQDTLKEFPWKVEKQVTKKGLTKAASRLRTYVKRATPVNSGLLKRSLRTSTSRRYATKWVWFRWPGSDNRESYFGQVARDTNFFSKTLERHDKEITGILVQETKSALYELAGKEYAKSKRAK